MPWTRAASVIIRNSEDGDEVIEQSRIAFNRDEAFGKRILRAQLASEEIPESWTCFDHKVCFPCRALSDVNGASARESMHRNIPDGDREGTRPLRRLALLGGDAQR